MHLDFLISWPMQWGLHLIFCAIWLDTQTLTWCAPCVRLEKKPKIDIALLDQLTIYSSSNSEVLTKVIYIYKIIQDIRQQYIFKKLVILKCALPQYVKMSRRLV